MFHDMTADGSGRMKSEAYRAIFFAQIQLISDSRALRSADDNTLGKQPKIFSRQKYGIFDNHLIST